MKERIALAFVFVVVFFSITTAQEKRREKVRIGLRGGVYLSNFKTQTSLDVSFTGDATVYGGVQVQIPVAKNLYIVPEVLYAFTSLTYHSENPYTRGTIFGSEYLSQILVPVQLKYQVGKFGFYLGGQADILANTKATLINVYKDRDFTDSSYKKVSFSAIAGAEFVFKYRFGIDFRYHQSLLNMRANNGRTFATDNGSIKLNAFQAGLFFRFGKRPKKTA